MYNFMISGVHNKHEYEELIKLFLPRDDFHILSDQETAMGDAKSFLFEGDKNLLKAKIYKYLVALTGKAPKWGIITGIRPVKLTGELLKRYGSRQAVFHRLTDYYLLHKDKADLLLHIYDYQQQTLGKPVKDSTGIYIGIPFCPTRCLYCSFTSNQVSQEEIQNYLKALYKEIDFVGTKMSENNLFPESIYIGGGTPTTLTPQQLEELINKVRSSFDFTHVKEFTIEAGRPDTITAEKLDVLKQNNIDRISINPQSMKDSTLELIGRAHTSDQIREAFSLSQKSGFKVINCDIIAGLPRETIEDFNLTLEEVIDLGAQNITVHTLAVKRASRLIDADKNYHYKQAALIEEMLDSSKKTLEDNGYKPYYLYKQKNTSGSTENIGYCKNNQIGIYNIRIMEEAQSIIALGAGGITKSYYPEENRLERVPNVSNYEIYIERIDEMLQRKRENLFRR